MKPSLQFSVPCLEVKEEDKPPTFQYLFYELPLPELPMRCPAFFINNGWCRGEGTFIQEIKILAPDRQQVVIETGGQTFTLESQYVPQLIVNQFDQILFAEVGHYWVQVLLDGKLELEYPITVRTISGAKTPPKPDRQDQARPTPPSTLNAPLFQEQ